ncbi:MarR family transcriptional regulator [Plantactinospora siamensis]|uniref:MarR family transcriptional regulator n=1 Tax=Plantactinospora siamensis TaxID=555372 RepID=A0ABV6NVQ9_9ACTN
MTERTVMAVGVPPAQLAPRLRDAITRLNRRVRQTRPVGDLTMTQLSALTSIELAGALTPRELADAERVQPPTMTRTVAKLEEQGLVRRSPHPTDGRQVLLTATDAGREVFARFERARNTWLAERLAELTDAEQDTLAQAAEIIQKVARA